ncbi:MAG: peptide chain release factor-like protein [Victivallales bacterium]|nr:peptide chain release factor-like protein [Victivallales bacterium]
MTEESGKSSASDRDLWLSLADDALLRQCTVVTCRGSGPGGQKRNKTSSAVRLFHKPSGVAAENDESRSQHVNCVFALSSLRLKIALQLRLPPPSATLGPAPGANSDAFFLWLARAFDILESVGYKISDAVPLIGLSTNQILKTIEKIPAAWQELNAQRSARSLPTLRSKN